jgi:hypothetical protein
MVRTSTVEEAAPFVERTLISFRRGLLKERDWSLLDTARKLRRTNH